VRTGTTDTAVIATGERGPSGSRAVTVATTVTDVLVFLVVLGLADQYVPHVLSESFTDSLLTAILLKVVLEVVVFGKRAVARRIRGALRPLGKAVGVLAVWLVLVASKFLVLETVDLVLGDRVSLGGFWSVTGLIVVLMLSRSAVRLGVDALLDAGPTSATARRAPLTATDPESGDADAGPAGRRVEGRSDHRPGRHASRLRQARTNGHVQVGSR
jgi:hypothetical protein